MGGLTAGEAMVDPQSLQRVAQEVVLQPVVLRGARAEDGVGFVNLSSVCMCSAAAPQVVPTSDDCTSTISTLLRRRVRTLSVWLSRSPPCTLYPVPRRGTLYPVRWLSRTPPSLLCSPCLAPR